MATMPRAMVPRSRKIVLALLLILLLGSVGWALAMRGGQSNETDLARENAGPIRSLALFGTIPIYWGEAAGMEDLLNDKAEPHWARKALEQRYELTPIDALEANSLQGVARALMAQPRALSPAENVALDDWVRAGGQLLLFADPMLTGHSQFSIGDKRRPQDVALLSPILARWGLAMEFDPDAPAEAVIVPGIGEGTPTLLSGRFKVALGTVGPDTVCQLKSEGLIAQCAIGEGKAMIVADAAIFDDTGFEPALLALTDAAF